MSRDVWWPIRESQRLSKKTGIILDFLSDTFCDHITFIPISPPAPGIRMIHTDFWFVFKLCTVNIKDFASFNFESYIYKACKGEYFHYASRSKKQ